MGQCACKDCKEEQDETAVSLPNNVEQQGHTYRHVSSLQNLMNAKLAASIDKLVLDSLAAIRSFVDNDQEPPSSMVKIHNIADKEGGWRAVINSLVKVMPLNDPLGPAVISLLLNDCPLPSKDTLMALPEDFGVCAENSAQNSKDVIQHRNLCVVLGCLAEKMAGPSSIAISSESTLDYIIANLDESCHPAVSLFAIIALEKFAQTCENKVRIAQKLQQCPVNPLMVLEKHHESEDYPLREVGFCAQWCLDNLFIQEGRPYSYETIDTSELNAVLDQTGISESLKLSANGLEARCNASSFESVMCTFCAMEGIWYFEVTIVTAGIMQIGWATKESKFSNYEGCGIGDDKYSLAYDGCRQFIWHNAMHWSHTHPCWKPGDILGCLLDLENLEMVFSLNGYLLDPCTEVFQYSRSGFYAAASFMPFTHAIFNFGHTPFQYPPRERNFSTFNDKGHLADDMRVILPRHVRLAQLKELSVKENACTLCWDKPGLMLLVPCGHRGFCEACLAQLETCPMCRSEIFSAQKLSLYGIA